MTGKHSGPEGRNSAKIEPKKCVTSLLKQGKVPNVASETIERAQKVPNVRSETLEKQ